MIAPLLRASFRSLVLLPLVVRALQLGEQLDVREASVQDVHDALFTGTTSCRQVVASFLARIEAFNPAINAITSLNPDALDIADRLDLGLAAGNASGRLFCVPILLKDNYDALPMNNTGSCLALAGNQPTEDAPVVKALKAEKAVIIGKTNLHELALEGLSVSSFGGQTLNPYDQTRTPGGSSGGTGAAIAASLAVLGTGTDTVNSLRSPASANSLVSMRPTRGLVSRAGIIPVSYTQDTAGIIARSVADLALGMTVLASVGFDEADNATALAPPDQRRRDYTAGLDAGSLRGLRLGVLDGFWNHTASEETSPVNAAMGGVLGFLRGQGAEIVNITESVYNATAIAASLDVQRFEYREGLDQYLGRPGRRGGARPGSFEELYGGREFLVIPSEYEYVQTAGRSSTGDASYASAQLGIQRLTRALHSTFARHRLDAVLYPEQKNLAVPVGAPSQAGRNGILAALTGFPVATVPVGFSPPSQDAPVGVPVGMEMLGTPFSEARLLNMASHLTRLRPTRRAPVLASSSVHVPDYQEVPLITPDRHSIPAAYPAGVLALPPA